MQRMFGDRYLYAGLGTTLGVGAVPHVESYRSAALNEDDLRTYRMLLVSSDDFNGRQRGGGSTRAGSTVLSRIGDFDSD